MLLKLLRKVIYVHIINYALIYIGLKTRNFLQLFKMRTQTIQFTTLVTLLLVLLIKIEGDSKSVSIPNGEVNKNFMTNTVAKKVGMDDLEPFNCSTRPLICNAGEIPPRSVCCRNKCVDLTSDSYNCGFCGLACPFNLQCCNRLCVNTNFSPFNCGACGRVCPIGRFCFLGACALGNPSQTSLNHPSIPKE
ncbi:hypothetical protein KIW84_020326 [Lathyrus oleraceus]|uniref:Stigma-specific Stig1 family protein n=1 Tax=Pisum sativum TaxID=3888 RepID=A0A9D5B2E9_PEA|nr:hypothetical protein KIW84_020326 [Pisum sativum]